MQTCPVGFSFSALPHSVGHSGNTAVAGSHWHLKHFCNAPTAHNDIPLNVSCKKYVPIHLVGDYTCFSNVGLTDGKQFSSVSRAVLGERFTSSQKRSVLFIILGCYCCSESAGISANISILCCAKVFLLDYTPRPGSSQSSGSRWFLGGWTAPLTVHVGCFRVDWPDLSDH